MDHVFEQKDLGVILDAELSLMNTFVRPHLKYGQVKWAPYLKEYVDILERCNSKLQNLWMDFIA